MSSFRTHLSLSSFPISISHQDQLLSLGSCFAKSMGTRLEQLKFSIVLNPFGILYNPISIQKNLTILMREKEWKEEQLFFYKGLWRSFLHHSQLAYPNKEEALKCIRQNIKRGQQQLQEADYLLITLGTAFVYVFRQSGEVVANCHKLPTSNFIKRKLKVAEVAMALGDVLKRLQTKKPNLKIIVTISPVRHLKEGLIENQRSKAVLVLALEQLCQEITNCYYFPSYELLLDDLRDYRFYGTDMIHPNSTALDYIWQQLDRAFFDETTQQLNRRIKAVWRASQHKAFHIKSIEHQTFLKNQLTKIENLENAFPFLNFEKERAIFVKQLNV